MDKTRLVSKFVVLGLTLGMKGGAVCGTSFGLLWIMASLLHERFEVAMLILGCLYGGAIGAAAGVVFGLLNGLGLGLMTGAYFLPLADSGRYRQVCLALSLVVTLAGVIGVSLTARSLLILIFAPFALAVAWWADRRVCDWYIELDSALRRRAQKV